jgi:hypothetical protein
MSTKGFAQFSGQATENALAAVREAQDWSLQATAAFVQGGGEVPSPAAVVGWSFDTAQKLLEQQRGYALRLTQILTPSTSASDSS